jgi:hypothetical protein
MKCKYATITEKPVKVKDDTEYVVICECEHNPSNDWYKYTHKCNDKDCKFFEAEGDK